jgi:hypothetical protein
MPQYFIAESFRPSSTFSSRTALASAVVAPVGFVIRYRQNASMSVRVVRMGRAKGASQALLRAHLI